MPATVEQHYGSKNIAQRILDALANAGVTQVTPQTLGPADQLHAGGIEGTRNLARLAQIKQGDRILDMGSGLGGPARLFASEFGADVTGIDLTPEFVSSATALTERCGLEDCVRFDVGSATALPYDDASFDGVITEHAVMNIEDRAGFYAEAFRVCRPGGTFAFFDCLRGEGPEPDYPLPWAESPTISFLHTPRETRAFISSAGFVEEEWVDLPPSLGPTPPLDGALSPATVFGSAMGPRMKNAAAAMADGRLKLALARFRKPE